MKPKQIRDAAHIERHPQAPRTSQEGIKNTAIGVTRSYNSGRPLIGLRASTRDRIRNDKEAEQAKIHKAIIGHKISELERVYDFAHGDDLENIAFGAGDELDDAFEGEAAMHVLAKRRQHDALRRVGAQAIAQGGDLKRIWDNVVNSGILFENLNEFAPDVARNQIGTFDWASMSREQIGEIAAETVETIQTWMANPQTRQKEIEQDDFYRELQAFWHNINQVVDNPQLSRKMLPAARKAFEKLVQDRTNYHKHVVEGIMDKIRIAGPASPATMDRLRTYATDVTENFKFEVLREAALGVIAESEAGADGGNEIRRVHGQMTTNPVLKRAFDANHRAGRLQAFEYAAPDIARNEIGAFDWSQLDLSGISYLNTESAEALAGWVSSHQVQLLARKNHGFKMGLKFLAENLNQSIDPADMVLATVFTQARDSINKIP